MVHLIEKEVLHHQECEHYVRLGSAKPLTLVFILILLSYPALGSHSHCLKVLFTSFLQNQLEVSQLKAHIQLNNQYFTLCTMPLT